MDINDRLLLTPTEAAEKLHCTEGTLANWRSQEKGPRFTKMPNGRIYYPEEAIVEFLQECSKTTINSKYIDYSTLFQTHSLNEGKL